MKKILVFAFLFILVFSSLSYASSSINVILDGSNIDFDTQPVIEDGTTLVPLRAIFETLGATVEWNNQTRTVVSKLDDTTITLTIDSKIAYKNKNRFDLLLAPKIIDSRTYVPVRFIAESFGLNVDWDPTTKSVIITTDKEMFTEYVQYSTGSLETLIRNLLKGNVIYYGGLYWATPEYATLLANEEIVYQHDIANDEAIGKETFSDIYSLSKKIEIEWISGINFEKTMVHRDKLDPGIDVSNLKETEIPDYYYIYAFTLDYSVLNNNYYFIPDMTDQFMSLANGTGVFSGIKMQKENGTLFFHYQDLIDKGIIKQ